MTTVSSRPCRSPIGAPVVHGSAAQRVRADPHARLADRGDVDHRREVADVLAQEVVRRRGRTCPGERDAPYLRQTAPDQLVRPAAITDVASVSAGPPCGGLYLKPPSAGGLCDGVTTMPSARPDPVCRRRWP